MAQLTLGEIAEQAGVRPARRTGGATGAASSGSKSNHNHLDSSAAVQSKSASGGGGHLTVDEAAVVRSSTHPGYERTLHIASGHATADVPQILEPEPVNASASSEDTLGRPSVAQAALTRQPGAHAAERSASAVDLYEQAIRAAQQADGNPQHHNSDPLRRIPRSSSTPPEARQDFDQASKELQHELHKQQQQQQDHAHYDAHHHRYANSPHLHPPAPAQVHVQQGSGLRHSHDARQRHDSQRIGSGESRHGSDTSPASDPSPGSLASTSLVPEHHRAYPVSSPYTQHGATATPLGYHHTPSPAQLSASSSPTYIQHHQQHPTYAYHTQFYAPQYHYPPPSDPQPAFYSSSTHMGMQAPHSPVQQQPQTFYPQPAYYYPTQPTSFGQATTSVPQSATHFRFDSAAQHQHQHEQPSGRYQEVRPYSAQSMHQTYSHQHSNPASPQPGHSTSMAYQYQPHTNMPTYLGYANGQPHTVHYSSHAQPSPSTHTFSGVEYTGAPSVTSASPMIDSGHFAGPGSQRSSIDYGHQYKPVHFGAMSPRTYASPASASDTQHMRFSTSGSEMTSGTAYSTLAHSAVASPYMQQHSRIGSAGTPQLPPTELARGYLAQSKFREALGAFDPNSRLPVSQNERHKQSAGDSRLPKPPSHSPWALWVGNVPADATHAELWRFFASRPPPGPLAPGSKEEVEALENEALAASPDRPPPDYNGTGIESIHLISRSNCCFVNMASKRHLDHAIRVCNGLSLRPQDPRCKNLVCRVRKKDDDNKTGVGAQRGKGIHRTWVAEHEQTLATQSGNADAKLLDGYGAESMPERPTAHKTGSASTAHSASTSSTTSSFLAKHFPKRFFILKSHSEDDLHLSVERGLWATQSHNEPVLDQAFRSSASVFLVFSANKSGEFFGYAKMAGPILKTRTASGSISDVGSPGSGSLGKHSSHGRKPEPAIPETPEEEAEAGVKQNARLTVRDSTPVLSPLGIMSNSPQAMSTSATPVQATGAEPVMDYLRAGSIHHNTAPSPAPAEKEMYHARKAGSLDPTLLAGLTKMDLAKESGTPDINVVPAAPGLPSATDQQAAVAASIKAVTNGEGVSRRDTAVSPEERNERLEKLDYDGQTANNGDVEHKTLREAMEHGSSKPFKIEWIRVAKLPFYKTRHLRNNFNGNREVKISRDGTEVEPEVGQELLELFWKDPGQPQATNAILKAPQTAY